MVVEDAGFLEALGGEGSDVHQADELVGASDILFLVVGEVLLEGSFEQRTVVALVGFILREWRCRNNVEPNNVL